MLRDLSNTKLRALATQAQAKAAEFYAMARTATANKKLEAAQYQQHRAALWSDLARQSLDTMQTRSEATQ